MFNSFSRRDIPNCIICDDFIEKYIDKNLAKIFKKIQILHTYLNIFRLDLKKYYTI